MKKLVKLGLVLCLSVLVITVVSCKKKSTPQPGTVKMTSFKYTPNSKTVVKGKALVGTNAVMNPSKAKATFVIKSIKKGTATFKNPTKGVKISTTTGKISMDAGNTLDKATYQVTIEATDKSNKKNKKTTIFKIIVK